MPSRHGIDISKAQTLHQLELRRFAESRPRSRELSRSAERHLLFGVPLHWMEDWSTPFSLYLQAASGAEVRDADGHVYHDFCLGDTGAMFGHAPEPWWQALAREAADGVSAMLPTADAVWVAEELSRRFGLSHWQFALSASDANRFAIRWARAMTGRDKMLVFNGCYHGTVDDVFVDLVDGAPRRRDSLLGQVYDLTRHTRVVEFNDLPALEAALADGEVACVLAEPAMTNIGMVLPQAGFWAGAQDIIRLHGSLLLLDETHTISSGPGGYSQAYDLRPDMLVLGKPLAGGLPAAAYGFSAELAARAQQAKRAAPPGHSGIGTTLTANRLTLAMIRVMLEQVMTDAAYQHMFLMSQQLADGLQTLIQRYRLPWCVTRIGARCEFQFCARPPQNGSQAGASQDAELEGYIHLYLLNRGALITPFHNMLLTCPATRAEQVEALLAALDGWLEQVACR